MAKSLDNVQQKQIFIRLLVFSLVTAMIWVFFSLFRSQHSSVIPPELTNLAVPLTPTIDRVTLDRLERMRGFTEQELSQFPIYTIEHGPDGTERVVQLQTAGTAVASPTAVVATPLPVVETQTATNSGNQILSSPNP